MKGFENLPRPPANLGRDAALVAPLVFVNALAAVGQVLWAQDNLVDGLPPWLASSLPFLFACAVESIALFLASQAHMARLAGDSAGYLSVAAYGWAGVAAWLQWSHWNTTSTTAAVVYAAMSALSPWLWGIWSRSIHRAALRKQGLIEARAVKFGRARWVWYPIRTLRVFRAAVWASVADPVEAIDRFDRRAPIGDETDSDGSTPENRPTHPGSATQPDPAGTGLLAPETLPAGSDARSSKPAQMTPSSASSRGSSKTRSPRRSDDALRLEMTRAIDLGLLPEMPSSKAIQTQLGVGQGKAQMLRDERQPKQGADATDGDNEPERVRG